MDKKTLNLKLSTGTELDWITPTDAQSRRFTGIANSGKPFVLGGMATVIDFASITLKPKTAVLIEHDGSKIAGVAQLSITPAGLQADGTLLNNEHGKAVAEASDQGFPWEMSVYVQSARWEELAVNASAVVNGHAVHGPLLIMRDSKIREVSFTAVGVDDQTSAVSLSDGSPFVFNPLLQEQGMTPEEQKAFDDLKAELSAEKAKNAALEQEKKKLNVNAQLSAAGFKTGEDGKFLGLSDSTYAVLLSAEPEAATALIADLKPAEVSKPPMPNALLSDTVPAGNTVPQENGAKLSAATHQSTFSGANYV